MLRVRALGVGASSRGGGGCVGWGVGRACVKGCLGAWQKAGSGRGSAGVLLGGFVQIARAVARAWRSLSLGFTVAARAAAAAAAATSAAGLSAASGAACAPAAAAGRWLCAVRSLPSGEEGVQVQKAQRACSACPSNQPLHAAHQPTQLGVTMLLMRMQRQVSPTAATPAAGRRRSCCCWPPPPHLKPLTVDVRHCVYVGAAVPHVSQAVAEQADGHQAVAGRDMAAGPVPAAAAAVAPRGAAAVAAAAAGLPHVDGRAAALLVRVASGFLCTSQFLVFGLSS